MVLLFKGSTVVGLVGSDEKAAWCKSELNFYHAINYKKERESLGEAIRRVVPHGVDIYIDNVGGELYHTVLANQM